MSGFDPDLEIRFRALRRQLKGLRIEHLIPSGFTGAEFDEDVACELFRIYRQSGIIESFLLLFDFTAPTMGLLVKDRIRQTGGTESPENALADIFHQLANGMPPTLGEGNHDFIEAFGQVMEAYLPERNPDAPTFFSEAIVGFPRDEVKAAIARNFARLPEKTKRCFYLAIGQKQSVPEIARQLGMSVQEVASRMDAARRQAYRELMGDSGPEEGRTEEESP